MLDGMKSFIANEDGSMPEPANFDKTPEQIIADFHYGQIAEQMKALFPDMLAVVADMEQFFESGAQVGDIIYCPERLGEPALAWILVSPQGTGLLLGSGETESIDWFLNFGPLEILQHPANKEKSFHSQSL